MSQFTVKCYKSDRPSFEELAELRRDCESLLALVTAVAECHDVAGRLADLHIGVCDLAEKVTEICEKGTIIPTV